jgi:Zn-dependent protease
MIGPGIGLFRMGETEVRLHPTFFLLLAIVAIAQGLAGGIDAALRGVTLVSLIFLCVLLHEFGHVFAARRYGIRTSDVTLWPFGGVASLERMPEKPGQEIVIALAGPAVNVVIALLLVFVLGARFEPGQVITVEQIQSSLLAQLAAANVALVVFNLIPAFPMDGGRVLRAVLSIRMGYRRATELSATIGQGIAVAMGLLGLLGNPMLILVAIFVFLAASGEAGFVRARDLTRHHLARDAMITRYEALTMAATADDAARLLLQTTQQEFPVVDGVGRLRGMVVRDGIVATLAQTGGATPVLEFMQSPVAEVAGQTALDKVFQDMQSSGQRLVAVVDTGGRLEGYITLENIAELVMIKASLQAR